MLTRFTRTIALLTFTLILFAAQAVPGLAQSTIAPEDTSAPVGDTLTVAIETSGFGDLDVSGYQFTASFDTTVIEVLDVQREGTISDVDAQFETNEPTPGELRVALASSDTLDGDGPLLNFKIALVGAGSTSLDLTDVRFFDPNGNEVDVSGQSATIESTVEVEISDTSRLVSEGAVEVPILLSSTPGAEPASYQFTLTYADSIVDVTGVATEGTLSGASQADPEFNQTGPGEVKVSFASSSALEAPGTLINLVVEPEREGTTELSFDGTFRLFEINGDEIPTRTVSGEFVATTNRPPEFTAVPADKSIELGEIVDLPADSLEATDPDGDEVTYTLLNPDEIEGAELDSGTGAFTFAPACQQGGMTFTPMIEASDGEAAVDTSFTITVAELTREAISVSIESAFGDPTESANYKQVGLPGQVDLPIDQTLEGNSPDDWRAFWDNGDGATLQEGLIEFDGSDQFNFRPGRGFWVLARNPWTASGSFDPVPLDENCNASIPLNGEGEWTMISNPLGKDISWAAVQSENGVDDPLWQKNSGANSYSQSQTFTSASEGGAYYFLNEGGLESLKIPYLDTAGEALRAKKEEDDTGQLLKLTVLEEETPQSSIWVGLRAEAEKGLDDFDHFAPPSYFGSTELELSNKQIDSDHPLAFDVRPVDSDGQTFQLKLRTEPGTTLRFAADGLDQFGPNQMVRLYDPAKAATYNLDAPVEVTPETKVADFALLIGDQSYVQKQESELAPDQIKLHQNYPNPFHQQTTLKFALPEKMDVRLEVYDLLGRRVQTLVDAQRTAGVHTLQWKGQAENGKRMASGTYLIRLQAGDQTHTRKMVLVR